LSRLAPTGLWNEHDDVPENGDETPITREDVNAIMLALMNLGATMEEIRELLLEDDGEDEEEPGT
jgi:hypothetical protein